MLRPGMRSVPIGSYRTISNIRWGPWGYLEKSHPCNFSRCPLRVPGISHSAPASWVRGLLWLRDHRHGGITTLPQGSYFLRGLPGGVRSTAVCVPSTPASGNRTIGVPR